jgi:putative thioredoxin
MEEIIGAPQGGANGAGADSLIKDVSEATFMQEVVQASMERPVIVDFWAPWCGPCKQLTPALEKVVAEARGKVVLAKVNVDENQGIAGQLRIQSIPTVYAFYQGRPLDGFQGALPEGQLREFVAKLVEAAGGETGESTEELLAQAEQALSEGKPEEAAEIYARILDGERENSKALSGVIRSYIGMGELAAAREIFESLPEALQLHADLQGAKAALELAEQPEQDEGELAELLEKVAHDPADLQARLDLAVALNGKGKKEAAAEELLEIVRRDRSWNEDAGRRQLVQFFEAWGPTDPVTVQARKRLSSLLFS